MSPVNVPAIGAYIREQREQAKISLRQLAQAAGVSNPYLSQIERGLRRPSADILQQIARGLRISAEALYVQAGFLEDRPPGSGVHDAVLTDPELTERQKQMLLEVYESFRKETAADNQEPTVLIGHLEPGDDPAAPPFADADAGAEAQAEPAEGLGDSLAPDEPANEGSAGTVTADARGAGPGAGTAGANGAASPDEAGQPGAPSAPEQPRDRVA
jgi:transcriptional regulator with XRE-family HTH domain